MNRMRFCCGFLLSVSEREFERFVGIEQSRRKRKKEKKKEKADEAVEEIIRSHKKTKVISHRNGTKTTSSRGLSFHPCLKFL